MSGGATMTDAVLAYQIREAIKSGRVKAIVLDGKVYLLTVKPDDGER